MSDIPAFRAVDIIARKRDGHELTTTQLKWFVDGCVSGGVTDYQAAAWLMAVYLRGMSRREIVDLTRAMAASGTSLQLGDLKAHAVDKHSTGGVGDKISLITGPIAAAAGVLIPKMSGRGLGLTGGTLDKLESIPGLRVDLSPQEIVDQVRQIGLAIASQSADLAPADGRLYALRDATATVSSLPLIVSSILSKKLASGAPSIVLDVKAGAGAFMKTEAEALELGRMLVDVGAACGRRVTALVSRMDQPLGRCVGNAIEVKEAIETLRGNGPDELEQLALALAAEMVQLAGLAPSPESAESAVRQALDGGEALAKLRQMVAAQGGDPRLVDDPERLPTAPIRAPVRADRDGFVTDLDAATVGDTMVALGAGRARKGDAIDHRIGVVFERKIGDKVARGDVLLTLHLANEESLPTARDRLLSAYKWSDVPPPRHPLILARLSSGAP